MCETKQDDTDKGDPFAEIFFSNDDNAPPDELKEFKESLPISIQRIAEYRESLKHVEYYRGSHTHFSDDNSKSSEI